MRCAVPLDASGCARRFSRSVFTVGWSAPSSYSSWPITGLGGSVGWPLSAGRGRDAARDRRPLSEAIPKIFMFRVRNEVWHERNEFP